MKVHILGGGIGGMSSALHLARLSRAGVLPADLEVHIYEKDTRLGGKAASQFTARDGSGAWPGEHGFRFFPNFYRGIVDTLSHVQISAAQAERRHLKPELIGQTVRQLIKGAPEAGLAVGVARPIRRATALDSLPATVRTLLAAMPITVGDAAAFTLELMRFLTACDARTLARWEPRTLNDLVAANNFSPAMRTFLNSLRALSAMRADRGSLRTLLFTAIQMLADFDTQYDVDDGLLPGPTDYLMLEPWEEELRRLLGADRIHFGHKVTGLEFRPKVAGIQAGLARVQLNGGARTIEASSTELVILAVPYEVAYPLLLAAPNLPDALTSIREVPQQVDNLGAGAEPMVGIQYWLKREVPVLRGHVVYPRVDWAMTSVSQGQFWKQTFDRPLADVFQAPGLRDVLSVIVSAWERVAPRIGKAPMHCSADELAREAFAQVADELGGVIDWSDVIDYHVDSDIQFSAGQAHCPTPLWVSPRGSYKLRPPPDPGCRNFFIAGDWARTETDVGSMESADEAARVSVRAIARRLGVAPRDPRLPELRPLRLGRAVAAARKVDKVLFDRGLPQLIDVDANARMLLRVFLDDPFTMSPMLKDKSAQSPVNEVILDAVKRNVDAFENAGWDGRNPDLAADSLDNLARELSALE